MNDHDLTDLSDLDDNDMALLLNKDQDHHRETDAINNDINEQNKNSAHHAMNSGTSQLGHKNGSILDTTVSASSGANKTLEKGLQEEPDWHISDDSDDDLLDLLTSKQSTGPNANTSSTSNKTVDTNIFNLASSYNRAPQNIDNDVTSIPKDGANTLTGNIFMIDQGSAGQNGHIPKSSTQLNSTSGISTGEHQNATEKTTREFAGANADIVNDDAAANADGDDDDDDGDDDKTALCNDAVVFGVLVVWMCLCNWKLFNLCNWGVTSFDPIFLVEPPFIEFATIYCTDAVVLCIFDFCNVDRSIYCI